MEGRLVLGVGVSIRDDSLMNMFDCAKGIGFLWGKIA